MDYLISLCDAGHATMNDCFTLHDELKLHSLSRNDGTSMIIQIKSRIFIEGTTTIRTITRTRTIARTNDRTNARNTTRTTARNTARNTARTTTNTETANVDYNFITT